MQWILVLWTLTPAWTVQTGTFDKRLDCQRVANQINVTRSSDNLEAVCIPRPRLVGFYPVAQ